VCSVVFDGCCVVHQYVVLFFVLDLFFFVGCCYVLSALTNLFDSYYWFYNDVFLNHGKEHNDTSYNVASATISTDTEVDSEAAYAESESGNPAVVGARVNEYTLGAGSFL
jgi:hypothetical protein